MKVEKVDSVHRTYPPAADVKEKFSDDVGLNAGAAPGGGSADGKGSDRGFHPVRDASMFNPQNTKGSVSPDSAGDVTYGGTTKIDAE
jgi:hypothetical protein